MVAIAWPAELPQSFLRGTARRPYADNRIRSETGIGPGKVRRRSASAAGKLSGQMMLNLAQRQALRTFFENTTGGGVLPFTFPDPDGGAALDCRFDPEKDPPAPEHVSRAVWRVTIELEILP